MLGLLIGAPKEWNGSGSSARIHWRFIICLCAISVIPLSMAQTRTKAELRREILSHYNKTVPPTFEKSPTDVGFMYRSRRIRQFDEIAGTLTVEAALVLNWMDNRLKWSGDPNYKNITHIATPPDDIWKPKINVFNSGRAEKLSNTDLPIFCTITGRILWSLAAELHPVCAPVDLRWYPVDTHICTLSLGSLYPQEFGDLLVGGWNRIMERSTSRRREIRSPHWDLLNLEHQEHYATVDNVIFYPTDDFIFTIRRQGLPLLASFLPLMACCICLSWSCFALPLRGKHLAKRLSVATCSLFLSCIFLLVLINTAPGVGQKPPVIVKVCVCVVVMAFLTSLHTVVVPRVTSKSTAHLITLQKLPGPIQFLLGLNKMKTAGGENSLLANMESNLTDGGEKQFQRQYNLEGESDLVEIACDRAHLILQITILTLVIALFCLV